MSFHDALKVTKIHSVESDYHRYAANISEAWSIGGIPHGGYAVGLVLSAVGDLQSRSPHPDPVHLTAHYMQPVDVSECEVRFKVVRSGKRFTNIDADLVQDGKTKIATRIVYGVLPDLSQVSSSPPDNLTLLPSSPYGRRIPFSEHPALLTPDAPNDKYLYQIKADDRSFEEQNAVRAGRQSAGAGGDRSSFPDAGLEWGGWLELKEPTDVLEIAMIPFFADCMKNLPSLLPREIRPGPSWFATMVLTVEFKSRIPSFISNQDRDYVSAKSPFSPRTLGLYASSRFMTEGRHDEFVEIWTSPSRIGSASAVSRNGEPSEIDPKWRDKQVCLAISTQMALTIPEENSRRGRSRL